MSVNERLKTLRCSKGQGPVRENSLVSGTSTQNLTAQENPPTTNPKAHITPHRCHPRIILCHREAESPCVSPPVTMIPWMSMYLQTDRRGRSERLERYDRCT